LLKKVFQAAEPGPGGLTATRVRSDRQPLFQGGLTATRGRLDRQPLLQGGLTATRGRSDRQPLFHGDLTASTSNGQFFEFIAVASLAA
jgi:hypothetical protein